MNHNDVARPTAHTLPARSLFARPLAPRPLLPRTLGLLDGVPLPDPTVRPLERPLQARRLTGISEGGR